MFVNKYSGECTICGVSITPGGGFVFKEENDWRSVCQGQECVKRACPKEIDEYKRLMSALREEENSFDEEAVKRAEEKGLFDYQVEGVKWITRHGSCIIADEQGLGKTAQTLISLKPENGAMIVAPSHLKLNWRDEAAKWRPDLKIEVIKNKKAFRFPEAGEIVVLTYGLLPGFLDLPPKKRKNPNITDEMREVMSNTAMIFDEVQALKNPKTIQFKRARELTKIALKSIGLTGTPIMNNQLELWNICRALGIEKDIFGNYMKFLYYFNGKKGKWGTVFGTPRPETPYILRKKLIRRERKEVSIQLPDKQYIEIQVELPEKERKILDDAWEVYKKSSYYSDEELPSFDKLSKEKQALASSKISVLKKVVDDFEQNGILPIVFSAHQAPVDEIGKRKGWEVIKGGKTSNQKHKIKDMFQKGQLKGLAATIKAAGTGLTLTRSHHMIFNDLDWVPANNVQAEDRIARIGQEKEKVVIYHLVADHPLDRHIRKLLLKKMALAHATLHVEKKDSNNIGEEETEDDFNKRVMEVKEEESNKRKEAITSRLQYWPTVKESVSKKRVKDLLASIEGLELDENDARIIRLLKFAGLETEKERQCLEAILGPYSK